MKLLRSQIAPVLTITCAFVSFTSAQSQVWAQLSQPINNFFTQQSIKEQRKSPDYSDGGSPSPGTRTPAGSRNPCPSINPPLTALMPFVNRGKTIAERPTFWFYVPYSPQESRSGEFVLYEEIGKKGKDSILREIYRITFTLPQTHGFVSVSIPPTQSALEINKLYRWNFQISCSLPSSNASYLLEGWVERIEQSPELEKQLNAANGREYDIYTKNLIWYDAIANLVELRLTQPTNNTLSNYWTYLLSLPGVKGEDLNPEELKHKPIVGNVQQIANE